MTMIKGNQGGAPTLDNIDLTHAKTLECEKCENSLFEKEIERNPIDFKMEIEQVFEPEDCTMVMEDYGKCQDYPCDDCTKRFLNSRCKNCWEEEKAKDIWDKILLIDVDSEFKEVIKLLSND